MGSAHCLWPLPLSEQRPMGYSNRWKIEYRTEVEGQARAPRVVTTSGVDQQYLRQTWEASHGRLQKRSLPQSQQS